MEPGTFYLFSFFNSSAAYRVRIAMGLKGLRWRHVGVDLRVGAQHAPGYRELNPTRLVPVLRDGKRIVTQSLAIIDYLDHVQPEPLLVPSEGPLRTRVLEIALSIACDLHPLNNMRVQKYLAGPLQLTEKQKTAWLCHWLTTGFDALEQWLPDRDGWCVGDTPTLADCCIVPQVANALRLSYDLSRYPRLRRLYHHCQRHEAFQAAAPSVQPDYVAAEFSASVSKEICPQQRRTSHVR
jgi:maleylpyruvate isomerase